MPDNPPTQKKSITPDWLVQGVLTKIGDTFDRLTGRGWKPSSSLATSELVERMKKLLDAEIKIDDEGRKYVPHIITLKMQWDKFSTDAEDSLRKLEHELLTAAVDHISDNRYYTHAPIKLEVKPDYFTQGVKLYVSYDDESERELNVTVPVAQVGHLIPDEVKSEPTAVATGVLTVIYKLTSETVERRFTLEQGRRLSIGRTKENDVALDHTSVSKHHASLLLDGEGKLVVADTGSTNGTYLNGERIAYGKAIEIFEGDKLKFGAVDVEVRFSRDAAAADAPTEAYSAGRLPVGRKTEVLQPAVKTDARQGVPTESASSASDTVPPALAGGRESEESDVDSASGAAPPADAGGTD